MARIPKNARHLLRRLSIFASNPQVRSAVISSLITAFLIYLIRPFSSPTSQACTRSLQTRSDLTKSPRLFIAIGSAPQNSDLRAAARETWLQWLPQDGTISYKFFTDEPPSMHGASALPYSVWRALRKESSQFLDVVFQSLPTGYGDKEHNAYSRRALYQMHWAVRNQADLDFFLRIDDDSFLCLHRLTYEMRSLPGEQFFWGKFWCNEGRNRADENFMLFSRDLINLLADDTYVSRLLPFDNEVTLGWNFGYWSWILNMTIFDDQKRIDAQQGYLTRYMHNDTLAEIPDFCEDHIYAHHVSAGIMKKAFEKVETHMMYPLPLRENGFACKGEKSFVPARHSEKLPNVKITHADAS